MNSWWRSWHGAPTDPKWLAIAQRAQANAHERNRTQINAGTVSAIVWALLDHSSQASARGSISSFDVESYAAFSGFPVEIVTAIIDAMKAKSIIKSDRFTAWEKRQPRREDGSAERAKNWRERNRTQSNANDHREDKIKNKNIDTSSEDFLTFWNSYPKKVGKRDAAKAYAAARQDVSRETILVGLERIKPTWTDPKFIPHPSTWLRRGGWDDQPNVLPLGRPSNIANIL